MAEPTQNKTALSAAAQKKAAAAAASPAAPAKAPVAAQAALSEDFDDEETGEASPAPAAPAEPEVRTRKDEVRTRKDQALERKKPKIVPQDDFIRDGKGEVRVDEDGDKMRYAAGGHDRVGHVTEKGVLFPNGFRFKGGHVQNGLVVLQRCPQCGHKQSIDEALSGECGNMKAGVEKAPCGYSAHRELEEVEL